MFRPAFLHHEDRLHKQTNTQCPFHHRLKFWRHHCSHLPTEYELVGSSQIVKDDWCKWSRQKNHSF